METLLSELDRWARETGEKGVDVDETRVLCDLLRRNLAVQDPADLAPGDLGELLLEVYPRQVTVLDPADAEDVVPAVRGLLTFLEDTKRLPARVAGPLRGELDAIEPLFLDTLMDPANWGPARSFTQAMAGAGVDLSDEAAIHRFMGEYNANLPSAQFADEGGYDEIGEFDVLKEALGLPDVLPPLRLPGAPELAAAARTSPLLGRVRELVSWIGEGRSTNEVGELEATDLAEAAHALGIAVPAEPADEIEEVPELLRLWDLAETIDFLFHDLGRVVPGEGLQKWPDGDDEDVLDVWAEAFAEVAGSLVADALLDPGDTELDFTGLGGITLTMLLLTPGLPMPELQTVIRGAVTAELSEPSAETLWETWLSAYGDPAQTLIGRLAELGAITVQDETVRLTPLGTWALREELEASDVEIPLLPPAGEMTVADLAGLAGYGSDEVLAEETAGWLARREPLEAARELLAFAESGDPAERLWAIAAAGELGDIAEPLWRERLDHPVLRPYAKIGLTVLAGGDPESPPDGLEPELGDIAWLLTDMIAATADALDPSELKALLAGALPPGEEPALLEALWRLQHPDTAEVLRLLSDHHPDRKVAKAARKAAFKAASRR